MEHEIELEIPFHDVDVMHVAWHGHYVKYLEIARCALLESIHYNCDEMERTGYVWPVIELNIRYAKPLRFKQKIRILAKMVEWENRLKISYTLFDSKSGQRLTKAYTVQVAVDAENGEMLFASPQILFDKLGATQ
nr:acyl-CoA thioesterase [Marinomonas posidonica]